MKICIVTSNRSEWGLLEKLANKMKSDLFFDVKIIVLGSHCSPVRGKTETEIDADYRIENLLSSDTNAGMAKSMALAMISLPEPYGLFEPDLILLLGDRYEIMAAAQVAYIMGIPIAHIHGGEQSGNIDDGFRDCITRLSRFHFCATEKTYRRIEKIAGQDGGIFLVGALGCEGLKPVKVKKYPDTILVVLHPTTPGKEDYVPLLEVLRQRKEKKHFILSNLDAGGYEISYKVADFDHNFVNSHLKRDQFIDLLANCKMIVGNSSAGIIEAPALEIPTINIGERQKNREKASSVVDCDCTKESIRSAFDLVDAGAEFDYIPYQGGNVSNKIIQVLRG